MKDVSLDEALAKQFHLDACKTLIFYCISDCPPCDYIERAIISIDRSSRDGLQILRVKLDREDKRVLGKAVLNGVSSFPRLDLFKGQELSRSMVGSIVDADDGEAEEKIARFLE